MQAPGLGNGAGHRPEEDISEPASRGSDHLRRTRREENRKKEETLTLNPEENAPKEPSKTVVFKPATIRGFQNVAGDHLLERFFERLGGDVDAPN